MVYKILSGVLAVLAIGLLVAYSLESRSHSKTKRDANNEVAALAKIVEEADDAYSKLGFINEDIRSENEELQKIIEDRDGKITALMQVAIKWKDLYIESLKADEDVVDSEGNSVDLNQVCKECLIGKRFMVSFSEEKDYLRLSGHTLTNPAEVKIKVEWIRDLKLNLTLTKEGEKYRVYIDSKDLDQVPTELTLRVDPSVFSQKWYQKVGIFGNVAIGPGLLTSLGILYDINNISIGPGTYLVYDGERFRRLYGVNFVWYPLK